MMKHRIIQFILNVLGIQQQIDSLQKRIAQQDEFIRSSMDSMDRELYKMAKAYNIGVDISPRGSESWAIICVRQRGGRDVIRFVDLSNRDPRYIDEFLHHMMPSRSNKFIDSPRDMLMRHRK